MLGIDDGTKVSSTPTELLFATAFADLNIAFSITAESRAHPAIERLAGRAKTTIALLASRRRAERSDDTLGLSQMSALSVLQRHGPLSPTALAEFERIQPPSMTRLIAALEGRGLIERRPHPSDRRQAVIAITAGGSQLVREDRRRYHAWLSQTLGHLDADERERIVAALPILEGLSET